MLEKFPIVKDIYRKTSLKNDIEQFCDRKLNIDPKRILNIVIKSLYAYRYEWAASEKISFYDIAEYCKTIHNIIQFHDFYINKSKFWNHSVRALQDKFWEEYEFYFFHQYALRMHTDFASSTEIFKDIVDRNITDIWGEKKYFWIDFWSWSGLLTIAQYIQARRNKFQDINNIGLELLTKQQEISHRLLTELDAWSILLADTTQEDIYQVLSWYNQPLNFISNETIPRPGIAMSNEFDPFYHNVVHLRDSLSPQITNETQAFPSKLWIEIKYAFHPEIHEWSLPDRYKLSELEEVQQLRDILYLPHQTVLDETFASKIFINGVWKKLEDVWNEIYDKWYIWNTISFRW